MSGPANPWLSAPAAAPAAAGEATPAAAPALTGPGAPQPGVPAPDRADQLPVLTRRTTAVLWWVGAHGGAGESTLAALLDGSQAAGHAWADVPGRRAPTVLVARTHARGLVAAQKAATQWAAGLVPGVDLLGLVLIADSPRRPPRELRDLARIVAGGVPRTWRLPWVESWRVSGPTRDNAPREVARLLSDLGRLCSAQEPPPDDSASVLDQKGSR